MNHKRSRNGNEFSLGGKNGKVVKLTERDFKQSDNLSQITPIHQPLWFWRQHSQWSYFSRGLFWGGLVGLTSVCSAMGGVALTTIDVVEQQISQQLQGNSDRASASQLATPLQILLVEVEPDRQALVDFSQTFKGKSKNFLLLEVEPEHDLARVINIPRDARIQIPEFGLGTVTDAYRLGGIDLLSQSLNRSSHIAIDRYLRTSPAVFRQLSASGKINLPQCDRRLKDCSVTEQIMLQQTAFETVRQRLNIPSYLASFKMAIAEAKPELDTNISMPELIAVVNFIGELEPDRLNVELLPEYTPMAAKNRGAQGSLLPKPSTDSEINLGEIPRSDLLLRSKPIAVQNTTDNPDLGRRVVAYLRSRNFRDVYLVRHIPLKLEQTRIVTNYGQVETANYLKNILGFGDLDAKSSQQQHLVLQLGEDALYLP